MARDRDFNNLISNVLINLLREVLKQKKSVNFLHLGGGLDKFGSFSHFFLLVLIHAKKGIFCGGREYHLT